MIVATNQLDWQQKKKKMLMMMMMKWIWMDEGGFWAKWMTERWEAHALTCSQVVVVVDDSDGDDDDDGGGGDDPGVSGRLFESRSPQ
jgi:hypothetical protein